MDSDVAFRVIHWLPAMLYQTLPKTSPCILQPQMCNIIMTWASMEWGWGGVGGGVGSVGKQL